MAAHWLSFAHLLTNKNVLHVFIYLLSVCLSVHYKIKITIYTYIFLIYSPGKKSGIF